MGVGQCTNKGIFERAEIQPQGFNNIDDLGLIRRVIRLFMFSSQVTFISHYLHKQLSFKYLLNIELRAEYTFSFHTLSCVQ